ncbi:MAG: UDP-N-acetylmuramate:L-alanyl-gamma-D-glutamyl-meso-diaminopimelate ligase [Acidobacteria bacterium]|nr:UDP-N-acetylmuramate:L-alanyl-gamma-D-glutamyl-meso-diaminopimelate ligase [Acidobacteriota bacterium]
MGTAKHIHLIGICGTAMASLAGMLQRRGLRVTGSDRGAYPPMSDFLAQLGIAVLQPFSEQNLSPRPDLVVVGNAISRGNPELEFCLDRRIPFTSMAQLLREQFLLDCEVLCVAGTHGKTTTTSMLAWIFETAAKNPSFLIGGIAENFGSSFQVVDRSPYFIIEGDEYDTAFFDKGPKFLHYFPDALILTSVEFDHADIYRDLEAVKTAFRRLVNLVPRRGRIVAYDGSFHVEECVRDAFCPVETYGFTERASWRIDYVEYQPERTLWRVRRNGEPWGDFEFALAGEFNVLNATAAAALAAGFGISQTAIAHALAGFRSVRRRLEVKAEPAGVTIIDDFAHHPTAIAATLKALRTRYPGRRLWAICEPRSNTLRRSVFQHELARSLAMADEAILAEIFRPEAIAEHERLDTAAVIAMIRALGRPAAVLADADAIVREVAPRVRPGDVIVILSNGGFGGIYDKLPQRIAELHAPAIPGAYSNSTRRR